MNRCKTLKAIGVYTVWSVHNARDLRDLRIPPANQLEALKGNRAGQYSIRINDQWRICFTWGAASGSGNAAEQQNAAGSGGNDYDVEIVDYH